MTPEHPTTSRARHDTDRLADWLPRPGWDEEAEAWLTLQAAHQAAKEQLVARDDWRPMVRAALAACVLALAGKAAGLFWMSDRLGARIEVQTWFGVIPYLRLHTTAANFATIVTTSTAVMATVTAAALTVVVLLDRSPRRVVVGWSIGVLVSAETLLLELIRHQMTPPVVRADRLWWVYVPLAVGAVVLVANLALGRRREPEFARPAGADPDAPTPWVDRPIPAGKPQAGGTGVD